MSNLDKAKQKLSWIYIEVGIEVGTQKHFLSPMIIEQILSIPEIVVKEELDESNSKRS